MYRLPSLCQTPPISGKRHHHGNHATASRTRCPSQDHTCSRRRRSPCGQRQAFLQGNCRWQSRRARNWGSARNRSVVGWSWPCLGNRRTRQRWYHGAHRCRHSTQSCSLSLTRSEQHLHSRQQSSKRSKSVLRGTGGPLRHISRGSSWISRRPRSGTCNSRRRLCGSRRTWTASSRSTANTGLASLTCRTHIHKSPMHSNSNP
mmetsp:Transcript_113082/g.365248  ORF Transcript_113082/g.365248 Transcript_113082/m.365248 type:complete len:203 (-) Transcript_113082:307-915(-)